MACFSSLVVDRSEPKQLGFGVRSVSVLTMRSEKPFGIGKLDDRFGLELDL